MSKLRWCFLELGSPLVIELSCTAKRVWKNGKGNGIEQLVLRGFHLGAILGLKSGIYSPWLTPVPLTECFAKGKIPNTRMVTRWLFISRITFASLFGICCKSKRSKCQQVIGDRGGHGHGLTVHTKDQHHIILTAFPSYFPTFSQL